MSKIRMKDFRFSNETILIDIPEQKRQQISFSARYLLLKAFEPGFRDYWHPVWYCFCRETPSFHCRKHCFKFTLCGVLHIDFTRQSGAVKADYEAGNYIICRTPYSQVNTVIEDMGVYMH